MNTSQPSSLKTFIVVGGIVVLAVFVVVVLTTIERAQPLTFKPGELVRFVENTYGTRTEADSALLVAITKNNNHERIREMITSGRYFSISKECHRGVRVIESRGNLTLVQFENFGECGEGWNDHLHDGSAPTPDAIRLYVPTYSLVRLVPEP
jgi:hypothetical protein